MTMLVMTLVCRSTASTILGNKSHTHILPAFSFEQGSLRMELSLYTLASPVFATVGSGFVPGVIYMELVLHVLNLLPSVPSLQINMDSEATRVGKTG